MPRLSPQDLYDNYRQGFQGAIWNQLEFDHLMEILKYPYFGDASSRITDSGKGKLSTPYKSVLKFDKKPYEERQVTGDCLVQGTKVLMSDGSFKNIEDIQIGESVITHNNRSKPVYELINKLPTDKQINHIHIKKYDKILSMTNDHKVMVFNDSGYEWIEAKSLKEGDLLVLPKQNNNSVDDKILDLSNYISDLKYEIINDTIRVKFSKNTLKRFIKLSNDLMWLIGLYAAEGGVDGANKERITFNLHIKETQLRDRIIYLLSDIFGAKSSIFNRVDQNVCCVRCSNIIVARLFANFVKGNQWTKNLDNEILNSSKWHKLSFLRGWSDGDGSVTTEKRRKLVGVSVSKTLIHNISDILISLQIQHTITIRPPRKKSKEAYQVDLYGDQVYKIYPELSTMTKVRSKQNRLTCSLGLLAPISKIIKETYTNNVYCINVKDDHSFIANGIISHNCVSHGTRNACDISRAVEIDVNGEKESWIARGATEAIYGARGWSGQGMTGSKAAEFVNKIGGILVRQNYKGVVDLTKYDGMLGAGWGGRGVPDKVLDLANDHQIKTVSLIKSVEEARDALANGYGIAVCSNYGFSNKRDSKGFARTSGSWAHCMAWIACDDTGIEPSFLVQNSWGCYSDDTEVLTKEGWKLFKDILDSDILATLNPKNHNLEWQQIQEKFEYDYNGYLNHYHFRGVDLLVTDNHKMYIGKLHSDLDRPDSWELTESRYCPKYIHIKKNAKWSGSEVDQYQIGDHSINMDMWLEFLGYFLSEGYYSEHKKVLSNGDPKSYGLIGISQKKIETRKIIQDCLSKLPFKFSRHMVSYDKTLYRELKQYGKAHQKFIPDYVKNLSSRQQKIFFEAMMLGDGSRSDGKINYYTSSKKLADDMQELILKIGLAADIIEIDRVGRDISKNNQQNITRYKEYRLNIKEISLTPKESNGTTPLALPYKGKIYCATVPNHIMYVRRNGRAVWCGNSWNDGG
ncbi:hypothetical protein EB118_17425, partial [bacterium]|nr:hypothetical protein [bacterium]